MVSSFSQFHIKIRLLIEWQLLINTIRDIHKSVADGTGRSRSCSLLVAAAVSAAVAVSAAKAAIIAALTLAVSEFLVIYNNIGCIDLLAILIYIASGLDSSGNQYTHALTEIFLRKFTGTIKSYDVDKIGRLTLIAVLASSASSVTASVYLAIAMERSPWE